MDGKRHIITIAAIGPDSGQTVSYTHLTLPTTCDV